MPVSAMPIRPIEAVILMISARPIPSIVLFINFTKSPIKSMISPTVATPLINELIFILPKTATAAAINAIPAAIFKNFSPAVSVLSDTSRDIPFLRLSPNPSKNPPMVLNMVFPLESIWNPLNNVKSPPKALVSLKMLLLLKISVMLLIKVPAAPKPRLFFNNENKVNSPSSFLKPSSKPPKTPNIFLNHILIAPTAVCASPSTTSPSSKPNT